MTRGGPSVVSVTAVVHRSRCSTLPRLWAMIRPSPQEDHPMAIDFTLGPELEDLRLRVRDFIQ